MTMMRVGLSGFELSHEQKQELTGRLIDAFCAVEVGQDVEAARVGRGAASRLGLRRSRCDRIRSWRHDSARIQATTA
jgi:hypothetical protein